jgi:hypothetical protein
MGWVKLNYLQMEVFIGKVFNRDWFVCSDVDRGSWLRGSVVGGGRAGFGAKFRDSL